MNLTIGPFHFNERKELTDYFEISDGLNASSESFVNTLLEVIKQIRPEVDSLFLQEVIEKTKSILHTKAIYKQSLLPLLTLLLKTCADSTASELQRYCSLVTRLEKIKEEHLSYWIQIITSLGQSANDDNIGSLPEVFDALDIHQILLKDIAGLFDFSPYPMLSHFLVEMRGYSNDFRTYLRSFDLDPKRGRIAKFSDKDRIIKSEKTLVNEQFNTSQVNRVIAHIINKPNGSYLTSTQQFELAQQVTYINAIGKDYPLILGPKTYTNLTLLSRAQLKELSDELIKNIRMHGQDNQHRLKARLNLIAVMREQHFRSTGNFINTTQILSILCAYALPMQNILIEMESDEEQAVKAFCAGLQWVLTEGSTVDVCFEKGSSVVQQYYEKGIKDFFNFLGIPSAYIESNSEAKTYQLGGINFTTISDLASYKARAKLRKEPIGSSGNLIFDLSAVSNANHKSLIDAYKQEGRVVGITSNSKSEKNLVDWMVQFDIDQMIHIPAHHPEHSLPQAETEKNQSERELDPERYYHQSVSSIQKVVVGLFEDWQALLHLIYPESDWKRLEFSLAADKKELIDSLKKEWTKIYTNLNVQREENHKRQLKLVDNFSTIKASTSFCGLFVESYDPTEKMSGVTPDVNSRQTSELFEKSLMDYERSVHVLWKAKRAQLKARIEGKVVEGSINNLRCAYLDNIVLHEQLQLSELREIQNKKNQAQARKEALRQVESGVEINGALLHYSDGAKEHYKQSFIQNQLKLIARDIIDHISQSSLSSETITLLINSVNQTNSLQMLELILIDYNKKLLSAQKFSEKYAMQPIIGELIKVHQQAGLVDNPELDVLKKTYLDNVVTDIVQNLETTLAWAKPENHGFWYWLERTAVKNAAKELIDAVTMIKTATHPTLLHVAIKNLYKTLSNNQAQLEELWIFSWGHANTRELINQTLNTLDGLSYIKGPENQLADEFIHECQEEAYGEVIIKQFKTTLESLENQHQIVLKTNLEWQKIKRQLEHICIKNNTIYVLEEMYHYINLKAKELSPIQSPIFAPLMQLRGSIRHIRDKFNQKHPRLVNESRHFDIKANEFKKSIERIDGFTVSSVKLIPGNTGFNHYYDLIVEGKGTHPLFNEFVRYHTMVPSLIKQRDELLKQRFVHKANNLKLEKALNNVSFIKTGLNSDLFPGDCQLLVKEVSELNEITLGKLPEAMERFPKTIQDYFHDRALMSSVDLDNLSLRLINKLRVAESKSGFMELYNKVHAIKAETPSSPWYSRIISILLRPVNITESEEDWHYQYAALKRTAQEPLEQFLAIEMKKKQSSLSSKINALRDDVVEQLDTLEEKIKFLNQKIANEEKKQGIMFKRFNSYEQLYDFELAFNQLKMESCKNGVISIDKALDVLDLSDEEEAPLPTP
jgi:hypothetical protein